MRSDVAGFIARLHKKDQNELLRTQASNLAAIEARVPGDATIYAVLVTTVGFGELGLRNGVMALSSLGVHWAGEVIYDWSWNHIRAISGGYHYRVSIALVNDEQVFFVSNAKKDSTKQFSAVVRQMSNLYTSY